MRVMRHLTKQNLTKQNVETKGQARKSFTRAITMMALS
jgi:hypothetical protein